jgi:DNA-binding NtrC family response regulator
VNVLIVESREELATLWQRHLERMGARVHLAVSQNAATALLHEVDFQIIVLDLVLDDGSALAVADFASYRQPDTRVIFVTNTSFFSDGSIFRHCANACAYLPSATPPAEHARSLRPDARAVVRRRRAGRGRAAP